MGDVVGVCDDNVTLFVKVEEWYVESDVFKMNTWRNLATKSMQEGGEVQMEVAVPG